MNILFDFVSTQGYINGGAEYTLKLFEEVYSRLIEGGADFTVFCLYNSTQQFVYEEYSPSFMKLKPHVKVLDVKAQTIKNIVDENNIDVFFIGIGQRFSNLLFSELKCRVCLVIHDVVFGEMRDSKLKDIYYLYDKKRLFRQYYINPLKDFILCKKKRESNESEEKMAKNILSSSNVDVVTVSNFSKNAINTLYNVPEERIKVFWSPQKLSEIKIEIENPELDAFIKSGRKYLLMLSVNREIKNLKRVLIAMERFNKFQETPLYLITTGNIESYASWHIAFSSLSASDLENAYKNCYALMYASLHEGFGYPPLEAMKYRKPVLSSNVCSLPEVLGDAPIYFSPFYVSDMVYAIKRLEKSYSFYCDQSYKRFLKVSERQKQDLEKLVSFILGH